MNIAKSNELWERAKAVIPLGTQTLSKAPDRFVFGVTPKFIASGKGSRVKDVDGNEYIDYPCGLGAVILGHAYPDVVNEVCQAIQEYGNIFTLMSPYEVVLAEMLLSIVPCAEMVRFAKNGGDATMGAIRIARAYTSREHIAYCGYHGCHDQVAITGGLKRGLPPVLGQMIHAFEYNNLESLDHVLKKNRCACVIMEQGPDEPKDGFLHKAIELAHDHGALFILDEIVTGFRYSLGGAQELYHIMPDIATVGKGMGNGFPISAIVGKAEYMKVLEDGVFFSFTFGGEISSIIAATKVLSIMRERNVVDRLWHYGGTLLSRLQRMEIRHQVGMYCHGNPVRFAIKFLDDNGNEDLIAKSYFLQETVKRGVLFGIPTFSTYSHNDDDMMTTLEVCDFVLDKMSRIRGDYEYYLEGEPIKPPYVRA